MAIANASQRAKSVADPNALYESMQPLWEKSRAVIGGERFTKDYDAYLDTVGFSNLLLPFSPSMTAKQYAFYKAEAELPGIVAQYVRIIIGGLLRNQPLLKLPEGVPPEGGTRRKSGVVGERSHLMNARIGAARIVDDVVPRSEIGQRCCSFQAGPHAPRDQVIAHVEVLLHERDGRGHVRCRRLREVREGHRRVGL